jgi:PAS domain S-box-containing protein
MIMDIHKTENFKEFEEKFKLLFDNAADPIFILDNKGKFIQINKKVKETLGYREKDLIGKKFTEMNILTKKSKLIALKNFIKRMAGFEIKPYEIEIIKKNGDIVIGEINASAIKENGKTIGDMVICRDITEKRKTDEQIKESEKKYKILYESSNDAIMTLEPPSWKFTSGNPATVNMFNTKDEKEFTSLGPWELSPEKQPNGQLSSEKAKKMIEKAMKEGSNFFEWTHKRYKGEDFPATVLLSRVELKGRKFLQATVRDISKEKKAQEEIEKSEKKFKDIITTIPDWVWELNERGQYTFVGQQIKKILGYKSEEILGKTPFDLMSKDEIKKIAKVFEETVKNKKSFSNLENWNVHKNGTKVLLETSGVPILDKKGNLIGYRGIDRDITERKIAEQKIKESEEKYRALISNIPAIVMNVDQNGKIMFINYTLPGFTIEKTIGKTIYDFIPPKYHDNAKETIKQVFKTGKASIYETIGTGPKGEMKYYSTVVGPIKQEKKVVSVILISSDITERKKAEERLRRSKEELQSKVEELEKFNKLTIGRELKMVELKRRIKELEYELMEKKRK